MKLTFNPVKERRKYLPSIPIFVKKSVWYILFSHLGLEYLTSFANIAYMKGYTVNRTSLKLTNLIEYSVHSTDLLRTNSNI